MTYNVFSGMLNPAQSINPDAGVYPSRQLCEVTAIWQIAYRFSPFVSEEVPVRPGHV